MHNAFKRTAPGLVWASLAGALTGCATTCELESLRAEVDQAASAAARAAQDAQETQREVAELRASVEAMETDAPPRRDATRTSAGTPGYRTTVPGYKWGVIEP